MRADFRAGRLQTNSEILSRIDLQRFKARFADSFNTKGHRLQRTRTGERAHPSAEKPKIMDGEHDYAFKRMQAGTITQAKRQKCHGRDTLFNQGRDWRFQNI